MDSLLLITFLFTSVVLIIIPGPNVLAVISISLSDGTVRGLQTVLGTSLAMALQLAVSALGTTWMVATVAEGLEWLRWLGVIYLLYLGIGHILEFLSDKPTEKPVTASGSFWRGFAVSLTNPKTLLFFSAFLPQFVSPSGSFTEQIFILSLLFLSLATILDGLYAILAGRLHRLAFGVRFLRAQHGISGLLYLVTGAWIATLRKV